MLAECRRSCGPRFDGMRLASRIRLPRSKASSGLHTWGSTGQAFLSCGRARHELASIEVLPGRVARVPPAKAGPTGSRPLCIAGWSTA